MLRYAVLATCLLSTFALWPDPTNDELRVAAAKAQKAGNFKDAYDALRKLLLESLPDENNAADLHGATECLNRLGRISELDGLLEDTVERHGESWQVLSEAATQYQTNNHSGSIVSGEFRRGPMRGRAKYAWSQQRDRVRALQLMEQAIALAKGASRSERATLYAKMASMIGPQYNQGWRLQAKTDLTRLPDHETGTQVRYRSWGRPWGGGGAKGAPVDEDGNPVFHAIPASWDAATSDGERWRFCLVQQGELDAARAPQTELTYAQFLSSQFGVQTLSGMFPQKEEQNKDDGPWSVHTLGDDETIAKLATGPKRFTLPDEHNPLRICERLAKGTGNVATNAANQVVGAFLNRRQYPKAAQALRTSIGRHGNRLQWKRQLQQIVGLWGRFENTQVHAAGKGAVLSFRFRNATEVQFEAKKIKVEKLLTDIKSHLESRPARVDSQKINLSQIGYRLVTKNETQYLGDTVASWNATLKPPKNHFDAVTSVTTPLQGAGAYLVTAKIPDGNVSRIIVWLTDAAIVKKPMSGKHMYFVADATTGKPLPNTQVEFFGYQQKRVDRRRYEVLTKRFVAKTNADGMVFVNQTTAPREYRWMVTARTDAGKLAVQGFNYTWYQNKSNWLYNQNKAYFVTDRPVYRPGQTVKYRVWVRNPRFDSEGRDFANQTAKLSLRDGRNQELVKKNVKLDEYGTWTGEFKLADDATTGTYRLNLKGVGYRGAGNLSFKVEEYKKPEYEVTIAAPKRPVMLGEKVTAKITAKYYFGAPVTNAKVKYKVQRTAVTQAWYPIGPWDWLYGPGYGWFTIERNWYPNSRMWCCVGPSPWWFNRVDPPELVLEREVQIGEDGTVELEIDTSIAKAIHDDQDHRYSITAEVVDRSRRTIVGTGSVIVARQPFNVSVWAKRGHYKSGEAISVNVRAGTLDNVTVSGNVKLRLMKISYDNEGKPTEAEVATTEMPLDKQGRANHRFQAAQTGQYRVVASVTDEDNRTISAGHMLFVRGGNEDGSDFRFNDLELIADKRSYKPGDTCELMINTDRLDSTVLLFARCESSIYGSPKLLKMQGKSQVQNLKITNRDMPNFYVEALTISNGKVHTQLRELYVPPEERVAKVEVKPTKDNYLPGEDAEVEFRFTDQDGKPFQSPTVVTVYDKSVEYIAGGSNVPSLREFFWKTRRSHYQSTQSNLTMGFYNLLKRGETTLQNLGVFGNQPAPPGAGAMGGGGGGMLRSRAISADAGVADHMSVAEGAPAPASAAKEKAGFSGGGSGTPPMVQPTVRKQFADTAYWSAAVKPNDDGIAKVSFKLPDDLTTWKVNSWTIGKDSRVAHGETEFITKKNLIVRMQAPRFFTERDKVMLSANVHNYLDEAKTVRVELELDGGELVAAGSLNKTVEVPADGETRVDWVVNVAKAGNATVRMKALTDKESDAVERTFPVLIHGMLKMEAWTGFIAANGSSTSFDVTVPAERRVEDTELVIRYSPTLAGALVDALPYLVDGPHNSTDGRLHRFVPSVVVQRILQRTGVNLKDVQAKRANLNAQQLGNPADRAKQWKVYKRNPVFDNAAVTAIAKENLNAIVEMQLSDGGWGWFSGWGERSTAFQTTTIVHGLQVAKANDVAIPDGVLERGVAWLKRYEAEQIRKLENFNKPNRPRPWKSHADNMDAKVFMVLADAGQADAKMNTFLYRDRNQLAVSAKAIYGLALAKIQDREKLAMIVRNINQYVQRDNENQTAWLKLPNGYWWSWYGNDIETHAWCLKLLAKTDPKSAVASGMARYILNNRSAGWWKSVRLSALSVEALADFLVASGEGKPNVKLRVLVDGKVRKELSITGDNLFSFDDRVTLAGADLSSGRHTVQIEKTGSSPLYYSAYLTNFTKEDGIEAAGLEVKVNREFYKLTPEKTSDLVSGSRGQAVNQTGQKYRRERIVNFAEVTSGDLIQVELTIESKNDYDYIVLEDPKPAGFEAVDLNSGYNGNELGAYMEVRDNRVVLYASRLARGKRSVSYRVRAEVPGNFSAMPTKIYGMHAPELKGNSNESRIRITDSE